MAKKCLLQYLREFEAWRSLDEVALSPDERVRYTVLQNVLQRRLAAAINSDSPQRVIATVQESYELMQRFNTQLQ